MDLKERNIVRYFVLAILCCLTWCTVTVAETSHIGKPGGDTHIVIGYTANIFYNVDPRDALGLTQVWARQAGSKIGPDVEVSTIIYKNTGDAEKALANNEVDILAMVPEEFLLLRAKSHLQPVLSTDYGKHFYNELFLLVREGSGITQIEQLRGKSIRIDGGQKGSVPMQWLDTLLAEKTSSNSLGFFGSIIQHTKPSQAVMPVYFGQADACLVSGKSYETLVELNPQLGRKLRILERSPGFATGILAVRKDIKNPNRDAMVKSLQEMHKDPTGRQIMTLFRINRLIPFMPEHLISITKVIKEHRDTSINVAKGKL